MKTEFDKCLREIIKHKSYNSVYMTEDEYSNIIKEVCEAKNKTNNKSAKDYRRLRRYDVIVAGKVKKLISPVNDPNDNIKYFVSVENFFDAIHTAHLNTGHGGRNRMVKELNTNYKNVTIDAIMLYLILCEACQKKAKNKKKSLLVVKPILESELNSRCQIDLIDLQTQPDGDYKFVLNYQDHLTKFVILKPLTTKTAKEVASYVMEIFTTFGAPSILQSDNGKEFVNKVISELNNLWDGIKIIHGTPKHSQSQGSVERANQDIENMIFTWMETNKTTKWSEGLKYVQLMKNRSFHDGIKQSPYEALFGSKMKLGLKSSSFPLDVVDAVQSEEELLGLIDSATELNENVRPDVNSNENNTVAANIDQNGVEKMDIDQKLTVEDLNKMGNTIVNENPNQPEQNMTNSKKRKNVKSEPEVPHNQKLAKTTDAPDPEEIAINHAEEIKMEIIEKPLWSTSEIKLETFEDI